jgi:RluA family pseudouridine synthase
MNTKTTPSVLPCKIPILYEDAVLIIVDKPAGIPTQATLDKKRPHVYGLLKMQLEKETPGTYLALHHRLDKDTSGVLLFCKDKNFNQSISDMFKRHEFEKIYWALTIPENTKAKSKPQRPETWQIKNHLAAKPASRSQRMSLQSVNSGGLIAITDFKLLEIRKNGLLIEARPRTGRMHQIRVHLAELGLPILGDDLYNPQATKNAPRMMLHAHQLIFKHPKTQVTLTITSPPPADFLKRLAGI